MPATDLEISLVRALPATAEPGAGLLLPLAGRIAGAPAEDLRIGLDGEALERPWGTAQDAFWGAVRLPAAGAASAERTLVASAGGRTAELGRIVLAAVPEPAATTTAAAVGGRVAIVLPAYEPDASLLAAQLASLRAQTHGDWVCVVADDASSEAGATILRSELGDDPRFTLQRFGERAGTYRNVERALALAAPDAEIVALCDQDDRWHPDKLTRLVAALHADPAASLAHHDLRITGADGAVLSPTAWTERSRSEDRLRDLVTANTVTGMACAFRRTLLPGLLPFPAPIGPDAFHDHWIAVLAGSRGRIAWIGEPLADYVQHDDNVLGHRGAHALRSGAPRAVRWRDSAVDVLAWRRTLAATALLRGAATMAERDRRELARTARGDADGGALAVLASRAAGGMTPARRRRTLGHEWRALRGALWARDPRRAMPDAVLARLMPAIS